MHMYMYHNYVHMTVHVPYVHMYMCMHACIVHACGLSTQNEHKRGVCRHVNVILHSINYIYIYMYNVHDNVRLVNSDTLLCVCQLSLSHPNFPTHYNLSPYSHGHY